MAETIILMGEERMEKTIESLKKDLSIIRTGRANPAILNNVTVDYYGVPTPINQMSSISVPEAQQLVIKPYDKSTLKNIERAIFEANLGLTPQNDGELIRINIPPLTEDRRKDLVKQVRSMEEDGKVSIRNIRRDSIDEIEKSEISEDEQKNLTNKVQDLVNKYNKLIEDKTKLKEEELMTV